MSESRDTLKREMLDPEYRYAYAEDFLNTLVATQIKVLREDRELTQEGLADLIGTKQAGISRLENVNYSSWKTETLRKIARALRVRLRITFEDFTSLLDDADSFSRENLERLSFEEDSTFKDLELASTANERNDISFARMQEETYRSLVKKREEEENTQKEQLEQALGGTRVPRIKEKKSPVEGVGELSYAALSGHTRQGAPLHREL